VSDLGVGQGGQDLLLTRFRTGVHQVGSQRVVEEVGVLGDHTDDVADRLHRGATDIDAVQLQGAPGDVVEAGDQGRNGGLARPRWTDQRHYLTSMAPPTLKRSCITMFISELRL
jgi:hypothetical protein